MTDIAELRQELADLDEAVHLHEAEADLLRDFLEGKRTPRDLRKLEEVYGGNEDEMLNDYEQAHCVALARIDALQERKAQIEKLLAQP